MAGHWAREGLSLDTWVAQNAVPRLGVSHPAAAARACPRYGLGGGQLAPTLPSLVKPEILLG